MTKAEPTYSELRDNGIHLFETLEQVMKASETVALRPPKHDKRIKHLHPARTTLLVGYANHAHAMMGTIIELLDKNRVVEAVPVVRSAYETALYAQWVYLVGDDAAKALANEHGRIRKAMQEDAAKSRSPHQRKFAPKIGDANWDTIGSRSDPQARNFKSMLDDIDAGRELYVFYRLMSEYCHPSMVVVDHYINSDETGSYYPTFQHAPKQPDPSTWMFFTLLSACYATSPISTIIRNKSLRNTIRKIANNCSISLDLALSASYYQRMRKYRERTS